MHPRAQQALLAYKELKWDIETISKQLDIEIEEARSIIASSEGVSEALKAGGAKTPEEVLEAIKSLAATTTSDKVKAELLKYLHAEISGRNNIPMEDLKLKRQKLQLEAVNVGMKVQEFNDNLKRSRELTSVAVMPVLVENPA